MRDRIDYAAPFCCCGRGRQFEAELDEELPGLHLERMEQANPRGLGMSAERGPPRGAAEPSATRSRLREERARALPVPALESVAQDLTLRRPAGCAGRRRSQVVAAAALLALEHRRPTLALFAIVDGVLLRPLPYPEPERLFSLWEVHLPRTSRSSLAPPTRPTTPCGRSSGSACRVFQKRPHPARAPRDAAQPRRRRRLYLEVLRTAPARGRGFLPEELRIGAEKVVIVNHGFWQRRFGGDPSLLGASIRLDGEPYRVVGILPHDFVHPAQTGNANPIDLQVPLPTRPRSP